VKSGARLLNGSAGVIVEIRTDVMAGVFVYFLEGQAEIFGVPDHRAAKRQQLVPHAKRAGGEPGPDCEIFDQLRSPWYEAQTGGGNVLHGAGDDA
jgi:hypothetical protein